jgi:hypothetical protein
MERYRVYYGTDPEDFTYCYADSKGGAEAEFHRYHPDHEILRIEKNYGLREMASEADEHDFLIDLIQALEDHGDESVYIQLMEQKGYGE